MNKKIQKLRLEEVEILFKNFRGEESMYNAAGSRTFSVLIDDPVLADQLMEEGWRLKQLRNDDEEEGAYPVYHLPVKLNFNGRTPPRVYKISLRNKSSLLLGPDTIEMLDYLPIEYIDVILNPYQWSVQGNTGIKAYCATMYAVIEENELDLKWAELLAPDPPFDPDEME